MTRLRSPEIVQALHRISQDLIAGRITPLESRQQVRALGLPSPAAVERRLERRQQRVIERAERVIDDLARRFAER
jgi:hypothetical protein